MRRSALSILSSSLLLAACDMAVQAPGLVPAPESVLLAPGRFGLTDSIRLTVSDPGDAELLRLAETLASPLRRASGWQVPVGRSETTRGGTIHLNLVSTAVRPADLSDSPLARDESYALSITPAAIEIRAATHPGLFYGLQTLRQALPLEATTGVPADAGEADWTVASMEIRDRPRFVYRGLHLDVGRHFFPPEFIKRYIDLLASYKLNVFHWHLTEDQGWRLAIDRYPRLTEIGAYRAETIVGRNFDPYVGDGASYGGFYNKAEVRDIVAYAAERFVTVIPEIELPGHSVAALAAYPELACTEGPFEVSTVWGVKEDIYCPHEATFEFLEGVLTEVMELFPSPYIHIGGDEAPKARWEESPVAQEVIRREGLADERELQSWFIRRIERFLLEHDRRLIGWDEILEGGLAPQATVMSWRGVSGGIEAARLGHDVIMTPTSHMYFDYYQGADRSDEPLAIGGYLPLEKVYAFEPVPEQLTAEQGRHVLGPQGNVWTEYIKTPEHVEYMAYPRALALAEVAWSPRDSRDWSGFVARLAEPLRRLEALGVGYRIPEPGGLEEDRLTLADRTVVSLVNPLPWGELRYTLDGSDPGPESSLYEAPLDLPTESSGTTVAARVILPDGRSGPIARATVARGTLRAGLSIDSDRLVPGVRLAYVEDSFRRAAAVADAPADRQGTIARVQLPAIEREEEFGLRFQGYLRVPYDDVYTFEITSDDGSQLYLNEDVIIDHDGYHTSTQKRGSVALAKGHHRIQVLYFQGSGGRDLVLRVRWGDAPFQPVPDEWFYVENVLVRGKALPLTDAP
jgi:hexosaminidase